MLPSALPIASLPRWLAPPVLSCPDSTRRAHALWLVSWPFFAVVVLVLSLAVAIEPATLSRRAVTIAAVGGLVVVLHLLNQRGHTRFASWMLVIGLTLIVTQRAWITGGIHAPVAVFYTLFILMAGALLGARAGIVTSVVCLACAAFLTVAEVTGLLAARPGEGPPVAALVFVVLAIGLALVVQLFVAWVAAAPRRASDDYVKMLVHDLRSPITAVQAQLHMLREDAPAVAPQVDEALSGTRTLERMASNLLDISRFEGRAMPVNLALTNVGSVVRDAVRSLTLSAPRRDIRVVAESTVGWTCDPELLRRIVDNLVWNAIKHTSPGDSIRVLVSQGGDRLRLVVEDEGPGIPAALRSRIFDKFVTGNPGVTSSGHRSAGLGLTFCKLAAEAHGGTIRLDDAPQRGSRFVVELPG